LDNTNDYDTQSTYTVVERPEFGFSQTELEHQLLGLNAEQDSAFVGKIYAGES
jgi:hypothetical protein